MNNNGLFHTRSFKILLTVCAAMLCLMLFTAGFGGEAPSNLLSFFSTPMQLSLIHISEPTRPY